VAQDGPSSPNLFLEFWDPRKTVANGMASGIQGPGAMGLGATGPGFWLWL